MQVRPWRATSTRKREDSEGRELRSTAGVAPAPLPEALQLGAPTPLLHPHHGAAADPCRDPKLVHEASRPGKPETESRSNALSVAQRGINVGDAGSAIADHDLKTAPLLLLPRPKGDLALTCVDDDVAGDLRHGGCDEGRLEAGKAEMLGHPPGG